MIPRPPVLVAFAGLPGVGKTTLAKALCLASGATYLRIDTIEEAVRRATGGDPGPAGYGVATALATENLLLGRDVVVDSVNPLAVTREGFADAARAGGGRLIDIELLCADPKEHRRRVEARVADIAGHVVPDWAAVQGRLYEPWTSPRVVIDTARREVGPMVALLLAQMDG